MTNPDNSTSSGRIVSIGHSNHELTVFLDLLENAGVTAIADVRSSPRSFRYPHFNKEDLAGALPQRGIYYVFLGDRLGGRPDDPEVYEPDGLVNYERVRATEFFQQGLQRLCEGAEKFRIAMMCSEADPLDCHRGLMIAPALCELGLAPEHLRGDGTIESQEEFETRLIEATNRDSIFTGLFADQLTDETRREELAAAYRDMAAKKAYRWKDFDPEAPNPFQGETDD